MDRDAYLRARAAYRGGAAAKRKPAPPEATEPTGQARKEAEMGRTARPKKQEPQNGGEVPQKDFAGAVKIYRQDIKPAKTKQGEFGQEQSTAFKAIKKNCHIQPQAAKLAFSVSEMEDAHRDDFLLCLNGLFKELDIVMPRDLVSIAEGTAGGDVIPTADRAKPKLATLAGDPDLPMGVPSDGSEDDLAEAGNFGPDVDTIAPTDDDFDEATEEELAAQDGRPSNDDAEDEHAEAAE